MSKVYLLAKATNDISNLGGLLLLLLDTTLLLLSRDLKEGDSATF